MNRFPRLPLASALLLALLTGNIVGTASSAAATATMTGIVRNSAGQPVPGASIFAGHTVYFNTNLLAKSGADGRYRIDLNGPAGSYYAGGQVTATLDGHRYTFDLLPDSTAPFNVTKGAVRNFTWKLTGTKPDGQKVGATVTVYADFFDPGLLDWIPNIELILTPTGPRIDGSPGVEVRGTIKQTPDGQEGLVDVPLGRYAISARYVPKGGSPVKLTIRARNNGEFGPSVASFFSQRGSGQIMEVEVSRER
ncbi:carboxypeptidase-like regulatory domain-containing protein [Deinococcus yavapaiensis]|uniref:Carboxypeptidase family protein n=1 Tax=Deinococcus yavapaiensis KR-236 TaxID=694435 RepID=A0A318S2L8_9DEIO|nr:carboxypeptidase-like regulatory domain-containing protein [Deinococcus yavapaiensis]PYE51074.1 hypothetical protein DES52_1153 [Deinococcus yavapaiensis KR-236]